MNLPLKKDLEKVFKKGKKHLIWYAWRNALRALPLLGNTALSTVWKEETVKHIFAVCRVNILLANSFVLPLHVVTGIAKSARVANDNIDAKTHFIYQYISEVTDIARISLDDTDQINLCSDIERIVENLANNVKKIDKNIYQAIISASIIDCNNLKNFNISLDESPLISSLWEGKSLSELQQNLWQNGLSIELTKLGLNFLTKDLKLLWRSNKKPLPHHWVYYAKNILEEILNTPKNLEDLIHGDLVDINPVRILLLGPGGAGKSTLADRLRNEPIDSYKPATTGINYFHNQPLRINDPNGAFANIDIPDSLQKLQLFLWDFGGQTLFYGLHKQFLHPYCVYILVVDSRHEQAPDDWLYQIKHLSKSGEMPPVLLVTNKYENCYYPQNKTRLKRKFGSKIDFFNFPCNVLEHKELNDFKKKIIDISSNFNRTINKSLLDSSFLLDEKLRKNPVINKQKLKRILKKIIEKNEINSVIQQLEGLGRLIIQKENILDPSWVIDHAYQFIYLKCIKESTNGIVDEDVFFDEAEYFSKKLAEKNNKQTILNDENRSALLYFIKESKVYINLGNNKLFFPSMSTSEEPETIKTVKSSNKKNPILECHLPYFPIGLSTELVHHWLKNNDIYIESMNNVWREGFILQKKKVSRDKSSFLVIRYQYEKAIITMDCFGAKKDIATLLVFFWEKLCKLIKPIEPDEIYPLLYINDDILKDNESYGRRHLVKAIEWLDSSESIAKVIEKMEKKTFFKITLFEKLSLIGKNIVIAFDKSKVEQTNK